MTVLTSIVIVIGIIVGAGSVYYYFRKKFKAQLEQALKSLGDLPQDMAPIAPFMNNTLKSEGADLPSKEGDKPNGNSDSTKSSDDLTDSAPSSNTNKENKSHDETNKD